MCAGNHALAELIRRELAPYAARDNAKINGPEVVLRPEAGRAMAMVLHELATNAAKYGALSTKNGRVSIRWDQRPNGHSRSHLVFEWREIGGPAIEAPGKASYGTSTIRDLIPYEFGGAVDFVLAPEAPSAEPPVEVRPSTPTTDQPVKSTAMTGASGPAPSIPDPQAEGAQALHLYAMGMEHIARGDLVAAPSLFLLAAKKGSVRSMRALAGTYDPVQLAKVKVLGMNSNFDAAREWYEKVGDRDAIEAAEQSAQEEPAVHEAERHAAATAARSEHVR